MGGSLKEILLVHISLVFLDLIAISHVIEFFINHVIKSVQSHGEGVFPLAISPAMLFNHFQILLPLLSSVLLHLCHVVFHVPPSPGSCAFKIGSSFGAAGTMPQTKVFDGEWRIPVAKFEAVATEYAQSQELVRGSLGLWELSFGESKVIHRFLWGGSVPLTPTLVKGQLYLFILYSSAHPKPWVPPGMGYYPTFILEGLTQCLEQSNCLKILELIWYIRHSIPLGIQMGIPFDILDTRCLDFSSDLFINF